MNPLIELQDLNFQYQGVPVLQRITFKIVEGEFIGIIGPNGGGKTTLLKIILGFLKPQSGKVSINGMAPAEARGIMAYVPQTKGFDRDFPITVLEVVLMGRLSRLSWLGRYSRSDRQIACESLEKVGLGAFANRPFGTLSGGQAQRVLIARALASQPRLLLLDEPTASVDAESENEINSMLKELSAHMTILMVTHDLDAIIKDVQKVISVRGEAAMLQPADVCEHFTYGLYHRPLLNTKL